MGSTGLDWFYDHFPGNPHEFSPKGLTQPYTVRGLVQHPETNRLRPAAAAPCRNRGVAVGQPRLGERLPGRRIPTDLEISGGWVWKGWGTQSFGIAFKESLKENPFQREVGSICFHTGVPRFWGTLFGVGSKESLKDTSLKGVPTSKHSIHSGGHTAFAHKRQGVNHIAIGKRPTLHGVGEKHMQDIWGLDMLNI